MIKSILSRNYCYSDNLIETKILCDTNGDILNKQFIYFFNSCTHAYL